MVARKKGKKGAFLRGHAGYGLRNADADAADEPDAGARANECRPVALHTHTHDPHECTRTHTHTDTHTRTRTHTATHCETHAHTNLRAHALTRAHSNTQCHSLARSLAWVRTHRHIPRDGPRVQTSCYSSASSSRHKA